MVTVPEPSYRTRGHFLFSNLFASVTQAKVSVYVLSLLSSLVRFYQCI